MEGVKQAAGNVAELALNANKSTVSNGGQTSSNACRKCGKTGHFYKECRSIAHVCYNCKELTTNSMHIGKLCQKQPATGQNKVSSFSQKKEEAGPIDKDGGNFMRGGYPRRRFSRTRGFGYGGRSYRGRGGYHGGYGYSGYGGGYNSYRSHGRSGPRGSGHRGGGVQYKRVKLANGAHGFYNEEDGTVYFATENVEGSQGHATAMNAEGMCSNSLKFIADSGASEHMINEGHKLTEISKIVDVINIKGANKSASADLKINTKGNFYSKNNMGKIVKLKDILYSQNLTKNLFSLRKIALKGYEIGLSDEGINW